MSGLMRREKLLNLKRVLRKMDYHPSLQTEHALVDHGLAALDLIDGGTTATNRTVEVRKGLADVREVLLTAPDDDGREDAIQKALFMLGIIDREMLSSDYRRYPTWADQRPRIAEEFE